VPAGASALIIGLLLAFAARRDEEPLSKGQYEQEVRSAYAEVQTAFLRTRGASGPELADRVSEAEQALRDAADELERLTAPVAVEAAHEQLVEGLREYAADLETLHSAIERGDTEAIDQFNTGIAQNDAIRKITAAAEGMTEEGYDVGPIAEE
jgi:hypothetical protein